MTVAEPGPTVGTSPSAAGPLDDRSVAELRADVTASIEIIAGVDTIGDTRNVIEKRVTAGEVVIRTGDEPDAVYVVLAGTATVVDVDSDTVTELAKLGPGQFFGELGVVHSRPRAATVVAETDLHLLRVEAAEFREWHDHHPHIQELMETLERVYRAPDGRHLSVYRGRHGDHTVVTTVQGDPTSSCVISTKVVEHDVVMFVRRPADENFDTVEWRSNDGRSVRVLHVVPAAGDRRPGGGYLQGVTALGGGPHLGALYRAVVDGGAVGRRELSVFRATGHLGGRRPRGDPGILCACLRVSADQVDSLEPTVRGSLAGVSEALGVGLVCGGCAPAVTAHLDDGRAGPSTDDERAEPQSPEEAGPPATIRAREPRIAFDVDRLRRLRATFELQLAAAASANSTPGERFLVATLSEAAPLVPDAQLRADIGIFLEQEANHIRWHSQLNTLLQSEVFGSVPALVRANRRPYRSMYRLPLPIRLALSAASEHAADVLFEALFEQYYASGARIHPDPDTDRLFRESGVSELFAWHGREELDHRHVAFDTMVALDTPHRTRVLGLALLVGTLLRYQAPALWAMRRDAGPDWATYRDAVQRTGGGPLTRLLAFARPSFHPGDREPAFMERLRSDTDRFAA